ncbi:MAG: hypothetical protein GC137_07530 [Alphaproteobacteria bacterium]|nr:hypothetical protein [Alphaproteobacteria bacterium]
MTQNILTRDKPLTTIIFVGFFFVASCFVVYFLFADERAVSEPPEWYLAPLIWGLGLIIPYIILKLIFLRSATQDADQKELKLKDLPKDEKTGVRKKKQS